MRFWQTLRRLVILALVLLPFGVAFWEGLSVRTTIVLLSETPIQDVRLLVGGQRAPPDLEHVEPSGMFTWHDVPTRGNAGIELTWRRPGEEPLVLRQTLPQHKAWECVHVLRLGAEAEPLPVLRGEHVYVGSRWEWLNSRCARMFG